MQQKVLLWIAVIAWAMAPCSLAQHFPSRKAQNVRIPQDQYFGSPRDQNFQPPQDQYFQSPQDQTFQSPQNQNFQSSQVQQVQGTQDQYQSPQAQNFQAPEVQNFPGPQDEYFPGPQDQFFQSSPDQFLQLPQDQNFQFPQDQLQPPQAQNIQAPQIQNVQGSKVQNVQRPEAQNVQAPQAQNIQAPQPQNIQAPQAPNFEAPQVQNVQEPHIIPLIEGYHPGPGESSTMIASVTLIFDDATSIVVDTPSGSNGAGRDEMLGALIDRVELLPDQVQMLVTTHGHPDHFGHDMLFINARHFFYAFEQKGTTFTPINYQNGRARLSKNVELLQAPGHTPQDVSVIVKNVPNQGTVAITGDLIYDANDALNPVTDQAKIAWDVKMLLRNRNKVLCEADYIVPGHGAMFQVTPEMRQLAKCGQIDQNEVAVPRNQKMQLGALMRPSIFQRQGRVVE